MGKTVFDDTPPTGTIVKGDFLNAVNNHRHSGRDLDGDGALDYALATGSANAYAITLSPALDAHITGMPIVVKANHANTGAATINVNGLGAVAIRRMDGTDLQAGDILLGAMILLAYDGSAYQLQSQSTPAVGPYSSVRQTVQAGPVTSIGLPSFLPATASGLNLTTQNINSAAPLVVSAAGGSNSAGEVNKIGYSTANLTWSSLTNGATLYLYFTIAGGVLTSGFTALEPIYQWGGTPSVTNGQATYNIQEGKMYLGNGSAAVQTDLVFVGEAVTSGGNITATVAYAYNGRYDSGYTDTLPAAETAISKDHNIGTRLVTTGFRVKCLSADGNYAVGDIVTSISADISYALIQYIPFITSPKTMQIITGPSSGLHFSAQNKTSGSRFNMSLAKWAYELYARREF